MTPFELFTPEKTAVLVVDKQRAYADRELLLARNRHLPDDFEARLEAIDTFIEAARAAGAAVAWTQMTEHEDVSPEPIAFKMKLDYSAVGLLPVAAKPGTPDYEIAGRVTPAENELVIAKNHYDSFSVPELDTYLKSRSITSVILIGGFMPRCVLGTAYGANSHDYHVLLLQDLCFEPVEFAADTPHALNIINAILGYVDTSANLLKRWH